MPIAAGVIFKSDSFPRYYDPQGHTLALDEFVWVRDEALGVERVGCVASLEGRAALQMNHLPKILRLGTAEEAESWYNKQIEHRKMLNIVREKAIAHDLEIKVSEVMLDEETHQVLVHYTAPGRIDFRALVRDLAKEFKSRIEMWQIGVRKEAGSRDGIGVCGHRLCCSRWLHEYPSVSMRHAKDQDVIQPPSKLSGSCGRLRCCLRYEHETYAAMSQGAPTVGCSGCTAGGTCGVVIDRSIMKREVTVRNEDGGLSVMKFDEFTRGKGTPRVERRAEENRATEKPSARDESKHRRHGRPERAKNGAGGERTNGRPPKPPEPKASDS